MLIAISMSSVSVPLFNKGRSIGDFIHERIEYQLMVCFSLVRLPANFFAIYSRHNEIFAAFSRYITKKEDDYV